MDRRLCHDDDRIRSRAHWKSLVAPQQALPAREGSDSGAGHPDRRSALRRKGATIATRRRLPAAARTSPGRMKTAIRFVKLVVPAHIKDRLAGGPNSSVLRRGTFDARGNGESAIARLQFAASPASRSPLAAGEFATARTGAPTRARRAQHPLAARSSPARTRTSNQAVNSRLLYH